jgi:hypothetical protein
MLSDSGRQIEEKLRELDDLIDAIDMLPEDDRHIIEYQLKRTASAVRSIPIPAFNNDQK